MNTLQIIGAIQFATGERVSTLAKKHNFSKIAFYGAINGSTKSKKVRGIISSVTGISVDELWPEDTTHP